ncbi:MAG: hypothetical protein JWO62_3110 [Acidimicrobiaceae bacterium]|nr:hypothetical protein [Acidimicrobiaceae bacterium]
MKGTSFKGRSAVARPFVVAAALLVGAATAPALARAQSAAAAGARSASAATPHSTSNGTDTWAVNWANGITFGTVDNVGPGAVADCTVATVADLEQIFTHSPVPPSPAPYVAAYEVLARAEGEVPGTNAGLLPADVLRVWRTSGIAGTRVAVVAATAVGRARLQQALSTGPIYAVVDLPASASSAATWIDDEGIALRSWTSTNAPAGYVGGGPHVVAVVGYNAQYVLLATWGYVQPVSWRLWQKMAAAAWSVRP